MSVPWTNRFTIDQAVDVLDNDMAPKALSETWSNLQGTSLDASSVRDALDANRNAMLEGIVVQAQRATVAAGLIGLRPEQFSKVGDLLGLDIAKLALRTALEAAEEAGLIDKIKQFVMEAIEQLLVKISEVTALAVCAAIPVVGWVAAIVLDFAFGIADLIREKDKAEEALAEAKETCPQPVATANSDRDSAIAAMQVMRTRDWSRLFMPMATPNFTCCRAATHGGRVIGPYGAIVGPVGEGLGQFGAHAYDRPFWENLNGEYGMGCLPMLQNLGCHRVLIKPPFAHKGLRKYNQSNFNGYDTGQQMPQLQGVGYQAYSIMRSRGPTAFTVDGVQLADAWQLYAGTLGEQIGTNFEGLGRQSWDKCGEWKKADRIEMLKWWFWRIGGLGAPGAESDDVAAASRAAAKGSKVVREWREFAVYQTSLLRRLVVAYVDARTCHPNWRERIEQAQRDLLTHPTAVCDLDLGSIPEPAYLAEVEARRKQLGYACTGVADSILAIDTSATEGPSLAPIGDDADPIPSDPPPPRVPASWSRPTRIVEKGKTVGPKGRTSPPRADVGGLGTGLVPAAPPPVGGLLDDVESEVGSGIGGLAVMFGGAALGILALKELGKRA
jgi:hypothetical protein